MTRIDRLRAGFDSAGIDALLVTDLDNIRYLTGFTGSAGWLYVGADAVLLTDGRYRIQAPSELADFGADVEVDADHRRRTERLSDLTADGVRLGLEAASISWAAQRTLEQSLAAGDPAALVPTDNLVERLRETKDDRELAAIEAAVHIADEALVTVASALRPGRSEIEIGRQLDDLMRDLGASGPAYETIVASGPNGALPHARPSDRLLADGDLVVIDVGALVDGYRSDMTRTFAIGNVTATQRRMIEVVSAAQAAGVAAVRPGIATGEIDAACRSIIAEAGWADAFSHGTGHGVGLAIHEAPAVGADVAATLQPGHVITVEPGVYIPEHGGVRVEDLVVVTADGHRVLTTAPKLPYGPQERPEPCP